MLKKINIKNLLLIALALTVYKLIFSMVTCGGIFNWIYTLEPTNVWKPMEKINFGSLYLISFVLNIGFVYIYTIFNKGLAQKNKLYKGLTFGLCVWVLGMLPGMLMTYSFMTVATTVIVYWTTIGLIDLLLKGIITSYLYKK